MQPAPALCELTKVPPVTPERDHISQRQNRLPVIDRPRHSGSKVAALDFEAMEPTLVAGPDKSGLRVLNDAEVMECVPAGDLPSLAGLNELAGCVLPDHVQHVEPPVGPVPIDHDQALIDQRTHTIERAADIYRGAADVVDVIKSPAAGEYGKAA